MKKFTVFQSGTGQILRTGVCQDSALAAQAADGESVIEGEYSDDAFYIENGTPRAIPPAPGPAHVFDHQAREWVDLTDMASAKARASAELVAMIEAFLNQFTDGYPAQEILGWGTKLSAAHATLSYSTAPLIEIEADALGIPAVDLAAKIVAKGEAWLTILARSSALRSAVQTAISTATSAEELPMILADAKTALAGVLP